MRESPQTAVNAHWVRQLKRSGRKAKFIIEWGLLWVLMNGSIYNRRENAYGGWWIHWSERTPFTMTFLFTQFHIISFSLLNDSACQTSTGFQTANEKNGRRFFRASPRWRRYRLLMGSWNTIRSSDLQPQKWVQFTISFEDSNVSSVKISFDVSDAHKCHCLQALCHNLFG